MRATLVDVRRVALVLGLVIACDRETPLPADAPPAEPATAVAPAPSEPATAPIVTPPPVPPEPQPHGFAVIRPGATVHLRADDSLPALKLAEGGAGFTMAVVGSEGKLIAFETLLDHEHCADSLYRVWGLRLRWLVAREDLQSVTTRRVTAEYSDGTKTELLAGVPLRADGDGWIARAQGTEIWVRLPADAVGQWFDAGDRAFAETTGDPLGKGEEPLLYDRTRTLVESALEASYADGKRNVVTFSREEKEGRTFAEVRNKCAAVRVLVPATRTKVSPADEAARFAEVLALSGTVGEGEIGGLLGAGPEKPTWYVEPGTTGYWRDGTVGGLVGERRTLDTEPRDIAGRMCFELQIAGDGSSRFDLCFDPTDVHETVGASPGALDVPTLGLLADPGEIGGGIPGGVPGGVIGGTIGGTTSVPRTRSGTPEITGTYDKDIVRRIGRAHIGEVRSCYSKGLKTDPTLAGTVTISFTIGPSGNVSSARVFDDSLTDASVGKCIAKAVKTWTFPAPAGGGNAVVRYPFTFSK